MKFSGYLLLLTVSLGCGQSTDPRRSTPFAQDTDTVVQGKSELKTQKTRFASIQEVVRDTNWTNWEGPPVDPTMPSLIRLQFRDDTALYFYHGQCVYSYPTQLISNDIVLYWDWIEDCLFDRGLQKTFGLKQTPARGKPFVRYRLASDTTLRATYLYPDWVSRFNQTSGEQDTIYPTLLRVQQP